MALEGEEGVARGAEDRLRGGVLGGSGGVVAIHCPPQVVPLEWRGCAMLQE